VTLLRRLFEVAVEAVAAETCLPPFLPDPPVGRTVVIGFGKAAAAMALAVETRWPGPLSGVVVTRYGHGVEGLRRIKVIEAGHPLPDDAGARAAGEIRAAVARLTADDLVLCLVSGGGSALLVEPPASVSLDEERAVTEALLRSGAPIGEINCVRKHVSAIKGGRLALACGPARIVNLIVSDAPGDQPTTISSGPTVPDPTTTAEAAAILARHHIPLPPSIARFLASPEAETPKPGHPALTRVTSHVIATAQTALDAAAETARQAGFAVLMLSGDLEGEARQVAADHAALALRVAAGGQPTVVLSGGETSVTVTGRGRGGRNAEYALALAIALDGRAGIHALACDTDGIDGTEDNAGAIIGPDTLARARLGGLDPQALLASNDAYTFFQALGDLVKTGPTRTNVNDFRAIQVSASDAKTARN
jgi:glycerate 2-kinase